MTTAVAILTLTVALLMGLAALAVPA